MIQNEYINNNYISERRYNNTIRNMNNTYRSNSNNGVTTTATQIAKSGVYTLTQKIVTKRIPDRKNEIYANFEKKLDKNNNLTKQKIKARIELKSIFKEIEDKELTKDEANELNSKIESIKKKYPNTVTDKILDKLYDTFKVKLPEKLSNNEENKTDKREGLIKALRKAGRNDIETIYTKGINLLVINELICYLKDNKDPELQERLNNELIELQTDRNAIGNLYIYLYNFIYPKTLKYMYESYRDGVKSTDKSRDIIPANQNAASYYLYLTHNNIQKFIEDKKKAEQRLNTDKQRLNDNKENVYLANWVELDKKNLEKLEKIEAEWKLKPDFIKKINEEFNANKEEICYRYFEFIKEKYNLEELKGIERLKVELSYISELNQAKKFKGNTEYLNLAISKELLSREINGDNESEFKNEIRALETKINKGEKIDLKILKLLGDMYYKGLKNASDEDIISQDKRKARDMYEQIIKEKGISANIEIYSNLINIYSDNTTQLYDKTRADKLLEIANKKRLLIEKKELKPISNKPSTYVCSDLHGEYLVYKAIIKQLKEKDKLYILGDVIDRGPDGIRILQDIMKRKEQGQVEFLIGNHELMMMQSLFLENQNEKERQNWIDNNGGDITLKAFEKLNSAEQNKIKEFLLDSYVYKNINVNSQNVHLVHAKSIQDKNDNSDKTVREMIAEGKEELMSEAVWKRGGFTPHPQSAKPGTFTVIGHSPTMSGMVEYENGFLDIDCGAGYENNAALVNLTNGTVKYFNVRHEREKENNKQKER